LVFFHFETTNERRKLEETEEGIERKNNENQKEKVTIDK
jgi:hypothetical protein